MYEDAVKVTFIQYPVSLPVLYFLLYYVCRIDCSYPFAFTLSGFNEFPRIHKIRKQSNLSGSIWPFLFAPLNIPNCWKSHLFSLLTWHIHGLIIFLHLHTSFPILSTVLSFSSNLQPSRIPPLLILAEYACPQGQLSYPSIAFHPGILGGIHHLRTVSRGHFYPPPPGTLMTPIILNKNSKMYLLFITRRKELKERNIDQY